MSSLVGLSLSLSISPPPLPLLASLLDRIRTSPPVRAADWEGRREGAGGWGGGARAFALPGLWTPGGFDRSPLSRIDSALIPVRRLDSEARGGWVGVGREVEVVRYDGCAVCYDRGEVAVVC